MAVQIEPMHPVLKAPGTVLYVEPLSNFDFNFNLRHYSLGITRRSR